MGEGWGEGSKHPAERQIANIAAMRIAYTPSPTLPRFAGEGVEALTIVFPNTVYNVCEP